MGTEAPRSVLRMLGKRVTRWLALGAAAGATLGLLELGVAVLLLAFLESLGIETGVARLPAWMPFGSLSVTSAMAWLLALALVRAIAHYLTSQAGHAAQLELAARLRRLSLRRLLAKAGPFVPSAEVNAQLADTIPKTAMAISALASLVVALAQSLVLATLLVWAAPREAVFGLSGLALVGWLVLLVHRGARRAVAGIPAEQAAVHRGIQRVARNFLLVRVLRTSDAEAERLESSVEALTRDAERASMLSSLAYASTPFFGTVLVAAIVVFSRTTLDTEPARLVAFLYLFVRFVQTIAMATRTLSSVSLAWPQLVRSVAFVDANHGLGLEARGASDANGERIAHTTRSAPRIELRDVSFSYEGSDDAVRSVSATVAPGEQLAVIGPSGSGKSTLLLLTLGMLEPRGGSITLDGDPPAVFLARAGSRVGYVGAEPFLLAGSLKENLLYGNTLAPSSEAIDRALAAVRLTDVVGARPGGLAWHLDENGGGLSAGEQQRLCLARALLNEPALLILDEVSANLDARTEEDIARAVREYGAQCTTIVVSHRPGMLEHADRVVELSAA